MQRLLIEAATEGLLESAHDCAEGGLAVTLAECCFDGDGIGVAVDMPAQTIDGRPDLSLVATLFGESASRVIVSVAEQQADTVMTRAAQAGVPATILGRTGGARVHVSVDGTAVIDMPVAVAEQIWTTGLSRYFGSRAA